jgi:TRAP-type C4-dicarboxylate transport system permease small subunit
VGGEADSGTEIVSAEGLRAETTRKLCLVQLAVGVPAFLLVLLGIVLGYRLARRDLGGVAFWCVLAPVVAGFAVYCARAILRLRRTTGGPAEAAPIANEEREP